MKKATYRLMNKSMDYSLDTDIFRLESDDLHKKIQDRIESVFQYARNPKTKSYSNPMKFKKNANSKVIGIVKILVRTRCSLQIY